MQSGLVRAICQMGIFMICAQAIVHFRPKASYEKYLKMLVSAMILIQLLLSVEGVFSPKGESKLARRAEWIADSLEDSVKKAAENSLLSEEDMELNIMGREPERVETEAMEENRGSFGSITVEITPVSPICIGTGQSSSGTVSTGTKAEYTGAAGTETKTDPAGADGTETKAEHTETGRAESGRGE